MSGLLILFDGMFDYFHGIFHYYYFLLVSSISVGALRRGHFASQRRRLLFSFSYFSTNSVSIVVDVIVVAVVENDKKKN